jgi:N-acetylglucosaminyl-diphospho-decaprenol L-rhamnosyltransferase
MPVSDTPKLSIIIVSYNTREMTLACLDSIEASASFETLVVDNASPDGSAEAIADHPLDIRLIASRENLGFAWANNVAAEQAQGEFLLLLNPDTIVKEGAIDRLLAFAQNNPEARLWGGRTVFSDGSLNATSCFARTTLWSLFCRATGLTAIFPASEFFNPETYGRWQRERERNVDIVTGCFMLIRRDFWRQLGGFDPDFFMYGEEVDLCLRAQELGARPRVTPDAEIIHHGGASEAVRSDRMVKVLKAKVSLIRRHWSPATRRLGIAMLALWPWTRWLALSAVATLTRSPIWDARASVWADIVKRRSTWLAGYPSQRARLTTSHAGTVDASQNPAVSTKTGRRPDVSVIIPHLDDTERLATCIDALRTQSLPAHRFEIVVCDNGSRCGLDAVWRAARGAIVVTTAERGAGPARNAAIAASRGNALAFIDSDCVPDTDWLAQGLAALASADLAGGQVRVGVADPKRATATEAFEQVFAFDNERYVKQLGFSVTANLFAKRSVFETIGGFRNGVPEDADWCRRARDAGFQLAYAPHAIVTHPARATFEALAGKWRRLTGEAFADWQKTGRSRIAWAGRAVVVIASPAGHIGRILRSHRLSGINSRAAALSTLFRIRVLRGWWMLEQVLIAPKVSRRTITTRTHTRTSPELTS